ncbi:MAG: carboxypeptidase regulatory-like domain-containing protein [Myxococcales bacterium]|nr:carboxypeptidase regulatory-like domain-containing protein [Myxococcales bacterium]
MILLALLGCAPPAPAPNPTGDNLFQNGCPIEGQATARALVDVRERPWGPEALARPGDVLLMNEHAAFVIQGVEAPRTYYHYGGAPIDAVALRGCEQAGPELFEELGFIVGQLELSDFNASTLHQVRGQAIEVKSDGADGGDAIVEVRATDDRFWLVEMTLVRNVWEAGGRKELGPLFGLDVTLRYTLKPNAKALQIDVLLGGKPVTDGFLVGALVFPSDELVVTTFSTGQLSAGGFSLDLGVPWLGMAGVSGSQAVAMPEASMAYAEVSGVRALLDLKQAVEPLLVTGAAVPPATRFLLGVGASDGASASATLEPWMGSLAESGAWATVSGTVSDGAGPVAGTTVLVEARTAAGVEGVVETLVTDINGHFSGRSIHFGSPWTLTATAEGRDDGPRITAAPGTAATLTIGAVGGLALDVVDGDGVAIPVRVALTRADGARRVLYALPGETVAVPPGTWAATVTRGYEYAIAHQTVVVPEGGSTTLAAMLEHVIDTTGWASVDTHVHAEASADSATRAADRFRTSAASGLDVTVSTDHEAIIDMAPYVDGEGLADWVSYGLGSEITGTVPEHVNAWPFPPDSTDARGDPVRWYQLGFPGIYAAARERGARVVQLNHARVNGECGILCVLDWDRGTDDPATADPEGLALPAGTDIWSWDFDSFELLNGLRSPLLDLEDPRHTGALHDWLAFLNLGHRITATAVTDVHGLQIPGEPRVYALVADDTPGVVTADDIADAELDGAAVLSAGAFATVDIGGIGPGGLASAPEGNATLALSVLALPEIDVVTVYVLVNCDLVATVDTTAPHELQKLAAAVPLTLAADGHVVTLGFGAEPMPEGLQDYDAANVPRFVTNAIYVDADGDGVWTPPGAKACATGRFVQ